jgi:methyl-coenzyme M reductase subunit D
MTDAILYPQCRIVTSRLLNPERVEKLMNLIVDIEGVRRVILNGPRLPSAVPYGPAKGLPNPHDMRKMIRVGSQEFELQVHVGTILLELETRDIIPLIKAACDEAFAPEISYYVQEGRFMKTEASLSDYARYGPQADRDIIGMVDPKSRQGVVILQGGK